MQIPVGIDLGSRNARLAIRSKGQASAGIVPNPLGQRYTLALSIEEPKAEADPMNDQFWDKPKKAISKQEETVEATHYIYGEAARRTLHRLKKALQPHFVMNLIKDASSHRSEVGSDAEEKDSADEIGMKLEAAKAFFSHLTTQAIHAAGASAHPSSLRFVISVPPDQAEGDNELLIESVEDGALKCMDGIGIDSSPDVMKSPNLNKRDKKQLLQEMQETRRVLAVITEPMAIAHAHGLFDEDLDSSRKWKNVLILDWGASSLTVTHLQNLGSSGMASINETKSESKSCGLNILNILVSHAAEIFERNTRGAIPRGETLQNKKAKAKLEVACEDALRSFGYSPKAQVTIDGLIDGMDCQVEIMLARFEMLLTSMLRTAEGMIRDFLTASGVEFDAVLCGGGIMRMKCVESMINRMFKGKWRGKSIGDVSPEEAIALGCASFAHSLLAMENNVANEVSTPSRKIVEEDAILSPVKIGVSFQEGDSSTMTMIEKATPLPALVTKTISLTDKNTSVLDIVQLSKNDEKKVLGKIEGLDNTSPSTEITMELSTDGQLNVMIDGGFPYTIS